MPRGQCIELNGPVHLDPDLRPDLRSTNRDRKELLFGQDSGLQTHLSNEKVESCDLFLFFGWFRKAAQVESREVHFERGAPDEHVIWGWLQIEKKIPIRFGGPIPDELADLRHHPFSTGTNFFPGCPTCRFQIREKWPAVNWQLLDPNADVSRDYTPVDIHGAFF